MSSLKKSQPRSPKRNYKVIAVVGPTASGKSALAVTIAKRWGGEVISADSRQVYRGMDIGTGKITKREMRGVPHHLIDVASPKRTFTVARFQKLGKAVIKKIVAKGKLPIIAGGTGLYVDALLYDYILPGVKPNPALRRKLEARSTEVLFRQLQKLDPRRAGAIDQHNRRRLVRALEIVLATEQPVPGLDLFRQKGSYDVLMIGIDPGRKTIERNIARWLREHFRRGMIAEVRALHEKGGLSSQRLDGFGLEYRYIGRYLRGRISKEELATTLEKESYRYAKRQMTWFRRNGTIHWIARPSAAMPLVKKFLDKK